MKVTCKKCQRAGYEGVFDGEDSIICIECGKPEDRCNCAPKKRINIATFIIKVEGIKNNKQLEFLEQVVTDFADDLGDEAPGGSLLSYLDDVKINNKKLLK